MVLKSLFFHSCIFHLILLSGFRAMAGVPAFSSDQYIGLGAYPKAADLNNDGKQDIVALKYVDVYHNGYTLVWLENRGTTFTEHQIVDWSIIRIEFELADVNGDGKLDIVTGVSGVWKYTPGLALDAWLENDGGDPPKFIPHTLHANPVDYSVITYPLNYSMMDISMVDMNGDGNLDEVESYSISSNNDRGAILWYENDGKQPPTFTSHTLALTHEPLKHTMTVADIDGDGRLDVVLGTLQKGTRWYQNSGSKTVPFPEYPVSPNRGQTRVGDLNGDGRPDVAIGFSWCENIGLNPTSFTTHLLAPGFKTSYGTYGEVALGDLDHDGHLDAVTYDQNYSTHSPGLYWLRNDGARSPTFAMNNVGSYPYIEPVLGDLDGDGNLDVLCSVSSGAYFYRNLSPPRPVTVLAPSDTGRVFQAGGSMTIQWRTDVTTAGKTVVLELWHGTKSKVAWLATDTNATGRGTVTVTLPPVPTGADYRIRAASAANRTLDDFSAAPFIIRSASSGTRLEYWSKYD